MSTARLPAALVADAALRTHARLYTERRAARKPFVSEAEDRVETLAMLAGAAAFAGEPVTVTVADFQLIAGEYRQADTQKVPA